MTRRTLRGTKLRIDESVHTNLYVCDICHRSEGPYPSAEAARQAGLDHWDEWHRTHRAGPECAMPGCDADHVALGYCRKHYMRVRRTGDPNVRNRR